MSVTLAGLLDGGKDDLVLREAEIVDWPDFPTVTHGINLVHPELGELGRRLRRAESITQEQESEYLRTMREYIDRLLARKTSCYRVNKYVFGGRYWRDTSPAFAALYRKVTAYAKARGIRSLVYALTPFCGLAKDFPDAPKRCLTGIGRDR